MSRSPKKTSPKKTSPKKTSPKKTSPKKTSPKKTSPKKTSPKKTSPNSRVTPVQAYDNVWMGVIDATQEDLRAVEAALGEKLPKDLVSLLLKCGGAAPAKNLFNGADSEVFELAIGYLLPLRDQGRKRNLAYVTKLYRNKQALPGNLIPFALDSGHANLLCVRQRKQDITYWLHDDPERPIRYVARDLNELLSGLEESPF